MRPLVGLVIIAAFLLWTLYRLLIKRDLKQNMPAFYVYLFFVIVWGLIYALIYFNSPK